MYGKGILQKACLIASNHGCSRIEAACNQLRKDTHKFYEREGMQNFHYKFSKRLDCDTPLENTLGR